MNIVRDLLDRKLHNNDAHLIDNIMGYLTCKCVNCEKVEFVEDLHLVWNVNRNCYICSKCCHHFRKHIKYYDEYMSLLERKNKCLSEKMDLFVKIQDNYVNSDFNTDDTTLAAIETHFMLQHKVKLTDKQISDIDKRILICENICDHIRDSYLSKMIIKN